LVEILDRSRDAMVSELRESYASIDHQFIISAVLVRYCSYTSVLAFTV